MAIKYNKDGSERNTDQHLFPPKQVDEHRAKPGRPKGSTSRLTAALLLLAINDTVGKPFEIILAEGFHSAILDGDTRLQFDYSKLILGKVVADVVDTPPTVILSDLQLTDRVNTLLGKVVNDTKGD